MNPTDNYIRARKYCLIWASALIASLIVGIEESSDSISILPLKFSNVEYLEFFVFLISFACFLMYFINVNLQIEDVFERRYFVLETYIVYAYSIFALYMYATFKIQEAFPDIHNRVLYLFGVLFSLLFLVALDRNRVFIRTMLIRKIIKIDEFPIDDLLNKRWIMHFKIDNPSSRKYVRFEKDGSISEGGNNNESGWRQSNEYLEIINSNGDVFSRFRFDREANRFNHTNDPDTLSLPGQVIELAD